MRTDSLMLTSALALALAAGSCRPRAEEERRPTAEPAPAPATEERAAPAPPPLPPPAEETVGMAETHGATVAADAAARTPGVPANLPPFEGELQVKVQGKAPESVEYAMKGDKIRIGLSATPGKNDRGIDAIIDTDDQKATILLNERKEFVEVDLAKAAAKARERIDEIDVERTGKTATVAGRTCEEWKIKDRDYQVTACVMKGAPYFDLAAIERQANFTAPGWVRRVVDAGYVPLRVSFSDASGRSLGSSEITDASRRVEGSKFEIPTGYKKTDAAKLTGAVK